MAGVRVATVGDAEDVAAILAPYITETAISFDETPPTPAEMATKMAAILELYPYLVFEDGKRLLGYAYGSQHRSKPAYRWSVETTVYVDRSAHRQGVGRALYGQLLEALTRQGFHSALAGIVLPNDKSVGLHEAMGFQYIGTFSDIGFKFGELQHLSWWQSILSPHRPTGDPIPFGLLST